MVILFSDRKTKTEKEIIEILKAYEADYISDKNIHKGGGKLTIISEYKVIDLKIENGIAVFISETDRFKGQKLPRGVIGICEDCNKTALKILSDSKIPVITCGMNSKNTVTLSSINSDTLLATLQRSFTDKNGKEICPEEFKIKQKKNYHPFSVMVSIAVLLLNGITPYEL